MKNVEGGKVKWNLFRLQTIIWRKNISAAPFQIIEELAKEKNIKFKAVQLRSREEAQSAPTPITTYALFCDGEYITNEQMNDKRFLKIISQ